MSSDVEDVTFLPGTGNSHKRSVYEPTGAEKFQQVVCSQRKAILIVVGVMVFIFLISLIAALARPAATCEDKPQADSHTLQPDQSYLATDGTEFPWKDIRLPASMKPLSYDIYLHPNLTTFHFKGHVNIVLQVTEEMNYLVLHSKNLNHSSFTLQDSNSGNNIKIKENKEYIAHEQIYLKLDSKIKANHNYTLRIVFEAPLSTSLTGFYKSSYKNKKGETRWIATTHFEPTDARAAFPCFDEPAMKASFKMTMVRDKEHISLFNTPRLLSRSTTEGNFEDEFEESVLMSTYLVAFVVCDYKSKSDNTSAGVKVSVYAPPDQIETTSLALEAAVNIIEHYDQFFGVPYPLPKQDLIAIPDFAAGAMENWGLITYRMTALLYDPEVSSESNKQWVVVVVAHELAHQWFGNLVTMKWWNDLWLNEGFASFVEYIGTDFHEKEWNMPDQFLTEALVAGLRSDSLSNSHPISVQVEDPKQINEIFDQISYDKGSSIIRMLENVITAPILQAGLQYYLNKHKFDNAETDDLWEALTLKANEANQPINVKEVMDTWTRQMGYPVVMVTREGNKVTTKQQRFLLNPRGQTKSTEFKSPYGYKWQIPLNYITEGNPNQASGIVWLKEDSTDFVIPDSRNGWIKLNVGMKGFYRVHYDENTWRQLIQQLMSDHTVFTPADRASLLDDAFALAIAGHLDITVPLDLTKYLVQEKEYVPWKIALDNFEYIKQMLEEKPSYEYYEKYVKQLIREEIGAVGWEDEGPHLQKYLRGLILRTAIALNHKPSVQKALELFRDWMVNGTPIKPNLKTVVYVAGVSHGGEEEWEFAWSQYQNTTVPSEKNKLLYALASTTDALRLNRYLHRSLEVDQIRKGDTVSVVSHVASNAAGKVLAWRFVRQNWQTFKERYGSGSFDMSTLIVRTASRFTTQYDYDEVQEFYNSHDSGSGKRSVNQVLESIEMNMDWLERNEKKCVQWLVRDSAIALPGVSVPKGPTNPGEITA